MGTAIRTREIEDTVVALIDGAQKSSTEIASIVNAEFGTACTPSEIGCLYLQAMLAD